MHTKLKTGINILVFLLVGGFVWYIVSSVKNEEMHYAEGESADSQAFVSPYKQVTSFSIPASINRFKLYDEQLFITTTSKVYIYDTQGKPINSFTITPESRDITVNNDSIYLLYPAHIEVYSFTGEQLYQWEACSELSDYCSFTIAGEHVFVTDAANKNICQYTREGTFIRFISSPLGFIVPNYSFDIQSRGDTIYCVNPGRHLIESYTLKGEFIAAFGGPGNEAGSFVGCCNPAYITIDTEGGIITSEKGNPRISSFERNGQFKQVTLNSRLLGGGNKAYGIQVDDHHLFVAGKDRITVYETNSSHQINAN